MSAQARGGSKFAVCLRRQKACSLVETERDLGFGFGRIGVDVAL